MTENLQPLTYAVIIPSGSGGGSRTYPTPFIHGMDLVRVDFVAEWEDNPVYFHEIQLSFNFYEDEPISAMPKFEGPSPLAGGFDVDVQYPLDESPTLALEAPRHSTLPAEVRVAVVDQPITLTFVETYRC